jgi:hypothetical protein
MSPPYYSNNNNLYSHLLSPTCNQPYDNYLNSSCIHGTCTSNNICLCFPGYTNDVTITRINSCSVPEPAIQVASWIALVWGIIDLLLLLLQRLTMPKKKFNNIPVLQRPPMSNVEIWLIIASLGVCGMGLAVIIAGHSNEWYWALSAIAALGIQATYMTFCQSFLTVAHQMSGAGRKLDTVRLRIFLSLSTFCLIAPYIFGLFPASVMYPLLPSDQGGNPEIAEKYTYMAVISFALVPVNIIFNSPISIIYAYRIYVLAASASSQNETLKRIAKRIKIFIMFISGIATPGILVSCFIIVILYLTHQPYVWVIWVILTASMPYVICMFILSGWSGGSRQDICQYFQQTVLLICCCCCCSDKNGGPVRTLSTRIQAVRKGFGARGSSTALVGGANAAVANANQHRKKNNRNLFFQSTYNHSNDREDSSALYKQSGITVTSVAGDGGGGVDSSLGPDF